MARSTLLWIAASPDEAKGLEQHLRDADIGCDVVHFDRATCPNVLRGRSAVYYQGDNHDGAYAAALAWRGGYRHRVDVATRGIANLDLKHRPVDRGAAWLLVLLLAGGAASLLSIAARGEHTQFALVGLCSLAVFAHHALVPRPARQQWTYALLAMSAGSRSALVRGLAGIALTRALRLLELLPHEICLYSYLNNCVEVHVNSGRYREAVDLPRRWSSSAREAGRLLDPGNWALVEINLAEAEYNLGRLDDAWQRVCDLEAARIEHPLISNAVLIQKAWIEALRGRAAHALDYIERADIEVMPVLYRAEVLYTRAAALLCNGDFDAAREQVEAGMKIAKRASSTRNGLFLLGTIAYQAQDVAEADAHFAAGAGHVYRCQGGDALLCWGDALRALGRSDDARRAYELVLKCDAQSAAAAQVDERLRSLSRNAVWTDGNGSIGRLPFE